MAEQAGHEGGWDASFGRGSGLPGGGGGFGSGCGVPGRDPHLSGFARDGEWDTCAPSAALAAALEGASGPEWRCDGASRDEMLGLVRQWQALKSRAAAGKLGVLRALIRDDDQPLQGGGYRGDLPEGWTRSLTHQVALALSMPAVSAENLMWAAWNLGAVLPGIGALLAEGKLTLAKARMVDQALGQLSAEDAARAEAMILPELPGKTYGQAEKIAVQAAITVDPESATRRRKHAERERARVVMFREDSGAAGLSGRDMRTDQTLAAHARVCARAQEYKDSGAFPKDTRMDQYRVAAYLDLLNGRTAASRIAYGQIDPVTSMDTGTSTSGGADAGSGPAGSAAEASTEASTEAGAAASTEESTDGDLDLDADGPGDGGWETCWPDMSEPDADEPDADERDSPCRECDGSCLPPLDEDDYPGDNPENGDPGDGNPDDGSADDGGPDDCGPDDCGPGNPPAAPLPSPAPPLPAPPLPETPPPATSSPPRLADLVLPLATLLGLAERPGEGYGLGPLDPDLCRELAIAAVGSAWTRLCVTVTDPDGIAIGHGCARLARLARLNRPADSGSKTNSGSPACHGTSAASVPSPSPSPGTVLGLVLPARVNLTIPAARLAELTELAGRPESTDPPGQPPWSFTRGRDPGPPGGFGAWTLGLPDGRNLTVKLEPIPTFACDHRHGSHAYQPNDALRHLVQIRDYECTFPPCSRHARDSDFEHAVPYDQGGRTCGCNAGARSRRCHQVKQSLGWAVTQPKPGWHQWTTPSGRAYTQGPKRYPA